MSKEPPHEVELRVGGGVYGGWKSGRLTQSLEQLAATWSLKYFDAWARDDKPWPIEEGDEVELLIDGERATVGYVDDADSGYSARSWDLSVSGRSRLGDLVDCSAMRQGKQWLNTGLTDIAVDLVEPFGLTPQFVIDEGAPFRRFKFEPGESVQTVLQRAAKLRGFILTDDRGELAIARPGSEGIADTLRRGENILRGRRRGSWRQRFSEYHFHGQTQATDEITGKSASQLAGTITDPQLSRYRPMVVISGGQDGDGDLGKRALLERNQRAGRGERLSYTVEGFRTSGGDLWLPNRLVKVEDPALRVDATLLVVMVDQAFGPDEEMVTKLELTRPEAFDQVDYPARGRGEIWDS